MDKINLKKRPRYNLSSNIDKYKLQDLFLTNKYINTIKRGKNEEYKDKDKDKNKNEISFNFILDNFNKHIENLKNIFKKNLSELNQVIYKQINNILNKIKDNIKEINYKINQYKNILIYNEGKIRYLQGELLKELLSKEILQNNVNSLTQKEKDYELIKEKTGIYVQSGKIINTNRKDNEIIILRTENSTLKDVIENYEKKLNQKELEFNKKNNSLIKEKNELILKIHNLNHQIQKRQISNNDINYTRYSIGQRKLDINIKRKSNRTTINESNDIIDNFNMNSNTNIPSTINVFHLYDNNCYIDYSNSNKDHQKKMNTIDIPNIQTMINHSHKNSICTKKIKDKFKNLNEEKHHINKNIIKEYKDENNKLNHTISISKNYKQNMKFKINNNRNTNNKIIIKENYNNKYDDTNNKTIISDRTKIKSHDNHLSNVDNIGNISIIKNNKNINYYFINNKPIRHIIHKKNNSIKVNNKNENNKECNYNNSNKENKENKKNNNLLNIKNLILKNEKKIKKNKMYLIYRNNNSNNLSSNYYSMNTSRNSNLKNNLSKLYTYNTTKVAKPKLNVNN